MLFASLVLAAAAGGAAAPATDTAYMDSIRRWQSERVTRLKQPDNWLSLVGLPWLQPGTNSLGSAPDNDAVLPSGPAHLGTVTWADDGTVSIRLAAGVEARIDDTDQRQATLRDDSHEHPTVVSFGSSEFYLIDRGGKKGLRVKDPNAAARKNFSRIDRFPIDKSWRIEARFIPFEPMHELTTATVIGATASYPVPGKLVFERDGKSFVLLPIIETPGDTQLFIEFADRTSGKTTYGGGRGVYIDMPHDGKAIIDFNKAFNPPCVFTPYATCDLPPPENRLDLPVTAGEKKYAGQNL